MVATIIRLLKIIGLFLQKSLTKEIYILQKRPTILRSLLMATPYDNIACVIGSSGRLSRPRLQLT